MNELAKASQSFWDIGTETSGVIRVLNVPFVTPLASLPIALFASISLSLNIQRTRCAPSGSTLQRNETRSYARIRRIRS